jgi:predicted N-acyltransferase
VILNNRGAFTLKSLTPIFIDSIHDITGAQWNQLCGIDYPFLRHEFFAAMEDSHSTCTDTGWQAHHLLLFNQQTLIALMPLFIKTHSYGEYVFDWAWAEAYQRHGMSYYPKLLNAIPFTPATGPRWAIDSAYDEHEIIALMNQTIIAETHHLQASSYHSLFTHQEKSSLLKQHHGQQRIGYQYHWFNKNYYDFVDFLSTMTSRKRKNINKERKKVKQQNIIIDITSGENIQTKDWENFYLFYQTTYMKRSGHTGYLSADFFPLLAQSMRENIVMMQASIMNENNIRETVAAALYFKDSTTLYGRYWGCKENFDSLHFELCYYQGIEYAIKNKLQRFDPGAQGEHKIQRGFTPIKTYSHHWIANDDFRDAIQKFLIVEEKEVTLYIQEASKLLPFKNSDAEK